VRWNLGATWCVDIPVPLAFAGGIERLGGGTSGLVPLETSQWSQPADEGFAAVKVTSAAAAREA
jgi:hypothetical protein